jgi:transcription elongation factor Elf1
MVVYLREGECEMKFEAPVSIVSPSHQLHANKMTGELTCEECGQEWPCEIAKSELADSTWIESQS